MAVNPPVSPGPGGGTGAAGNSAPHANGDDASDDETMKPRAARPSTYGRDLDASRDGGSTAVRIAARASARGGSPATSPAERLSRRRQKHWQERYKELCAYQREHGHCVVPQKHLGLGSWLSTQRKANRKGKLLAERVALLDRIGFTWSCFTC